MFLPHKLGKRSRSNSRRERLLHTYAVCIHTNLLSTHSVLRRLHCKNSFMRYLCFMPGKYIVVGSLIIILIIGGGIYYWTTMQGNTDGGTSDQEAQTTTGTEDQVQGQDVKVGEGKEATPGSQVSILYEGRLQDGTVFDSSAAHNNEPLVFSLGAQGLIPGFQIGVNGMREGGERLILIPSALGYGAQEVKDASGKVIIPANSALVFSIRLIKVEAAPAPTTP